MRAYREGDLGQVAAGLAVPGESVSEHHAGGDRSTRASGGIA
jgi:hypothetical protein